MTEIVDFGTLKEGVREYLYNRRDLQNQIPSFISLSERKIFRRLRCPANEKGATFTPTEGDPFPSVDIPGDYLELKIITVNDFPLVRISDLDFLTKIDIDPAARQPREFARILGKFFFWPTPDSDYVTSLTYWADFSGTLVEDEDTNDILRIAPDVYVYGAMQEAMPFLVKDERIQVWRDLFNEALAELNNQTAEAEYSGSPVSVASAYGERHTRAQISGLDSA